MKRFRKMVFGLVLTTAMMLQVTSVASASSSIQVNGHIEESGESEGCHITYHSNGGTGGYEGPDIPPEKAAWFARVLRTLLFSLFIIYIYGL